MICGVFGVSELGMHGLSALPSPALSAPYSSALTAEEATPAVDAPGPVVGVTSAVVDTGGSPVGVGCHWQDAQFLEL